MPIIYKTDPTAQFICKAMLLLPMHPWQLSWLTVSSKHRD